MYIVVLPMHAGAGIVNLLIISGLQPSPKNICLLLVEKLIVLRKKA